jgi:16S rRNA processing protein RimM
MAYKKGILLGRITRVSGFEGAVAVKIDKGFSENTENLESVFLDIEGRPVPFFIEYSEYAGGDILKLKFEGYDSPQKVLEFSGCSVFLTTKSENSTVEDELMLLKGFTVLAADSEIIGTVSELIDNPGQLLLDVKTSSGKSVLIPLHEDLIVRIDKMKNQLVMDIPEGLLEIN